MTVERVKDRLSAEIGELATISDADPPAVTRVVFTPTDINARAWLRARCEQAGLAMRQDPIGHLFARSQGSNADAPGIDTGSHIETISNHGNYDGVDRVLGGFATYHKLQPRGFRPWLSY